VKRIRLIHWDAEEAMERTAHLSALGHEVAGDVVPEGASVVKGLRRNPPDAVVIDLTRLPAHGREIARSLRLAPRLRRIPIVFVGGEPGKVARVRELLPDAAFTGWERVGPALKRALENPPANPFVPPDHPGADTGRPAAVKLGLKPGMAVRLVGAPADVVDLLTSTAPAGVTFRTDARGRVDLVLLFAADTAAFTRGLKDLAGRADLPAFWVAWPKLSSGVETDLTQNRVRDAARAAGFIDSKICGIDAVWSGLRFTRQKSAPRRTPEPFE
jgi:CheY-like chemotaxis protein